MDTKFWGPSGWELLHLITFEKGSLQKKKQLFKVLNKVLPCKYCRESTTQFMKELPLKNNLALWLYDLHKMVNQKLIDQNLHVEPNPGFSQVVKKYKEKLRSPGIPGKEFLLSIALNFDSKTHDIKAHEQFWDALKDLYPKHKFEAPRINQYYFEDVWKILHDMGYEKSYEETLAYISKFKSKCSKKTFKGKTCRSNRANKRNMILTNKRNRHII
jgi:hypothetical protein